MAKQKIDLASWLQLNVDPISRIIYLGSISNLHEQDAGVDFSMAEQAIKSLLALDLLEPSGKKPITVLLNTPGGDKDHGLAIYDAIRSCKNPVNVVVYGAAYSMGSLILQAASHRVVAPNARIMLHYGHLSISDNPQTVYRWADESKKMDRKFEDIYLERIYEKHPNFSREKIQELLKIDTILSAQEAVDLGLADTVLEYRD